MDFKVNTSRLYIIVQQVQYRRRRPLALTLLFSETLEGRENKEAQIDFFFFKSILLLLLLAHRSNVLPCVPYRNR